MRTEDEVAPSQQKRQPHIRVKKPHLPNNSNEPNTNDTSAYKLLVLCILCFAIGYVGGMACILKSIKRAPPQCYSIYIHEYWPVTFDTSNSNTTITTTTTNDDTSDSIISEFHTQSGKFLKYKNNSAGPNSRNWYSGYLDFGNGLRQPVLFSRNVCY